MEYFESLYKEEHNAVTRIWVALGVRTYAEAQGKSVWELVEDRVARIADLEYYLARTKGDITVALDCSKANRKMCDQMEAQAARLREALNKYGKHDRDCSIPHSPYCSCGLEEALAHQQQAEKGGRAMKANEIRKAGELLQLTAEYEILRRRMTEGKWVMQIDCYPDDEPTIQIGDVVVHVSKATLYAIADLAKANLDREIEDITKQLNEMGVVIEKENE